MKSPSPSAGRDDPQQTLQLALQFHRQGRLDEAERHYVAILAKRPSDVEANHLLGALKLQQGRNADAIRLMSAALKVNRRLPLTLTNLGLALERTGRLKEALAAYDEAIAVKPDHAPALNNRGLALLAAGRVGEALTSFDRALAIDPNYVDALSNRGLVLLELGRREAALASLERAVTINPNHVDALANRGRALIELGRPETALASLDRALAIYPAHVIALNHRGGALTELGRDDEALASFERALAVRPDYSEAYENKASALAQRGRMAEAASTIAKAIEVAPKRARAYFLSTTYTKVTPGDPRLPAMETLANEQAALPIAEQIDLNFALAKAYRDLGDPARSFPRIAAGAALRRGTIAYDEARALKGFERAAKTFTRELMAHDADRADPRRAPEGFRRRRNRRLRQGGRGAAGEGEDRDAISRVCGRVVARTSACARGRLCTAHPRARACGGARHQQNAGEFHLSRAYSPGAAERAGHPCAARPARHLLFRLLAEFRARRRALCL
jgi:tetratricopeptide (TPR) repeat protein